MNTITISRIKYRELRRKAAAYEATLDVPEEVSKRSPTKLDRGLAAAIKEYREGKGYGPFSTAKGAVSFLKQRRQQR